MNSRLMWLLAACGPLGWVAPVGADVWDPTADFSIQNGNPNGPWSYASMNTGFGAFTLMPYLGLSKGCPVWWAWAGWIQGPHIWKSTLHSTLHGVAPGELSLHPGPGFEPSILRWTAPAGVSGTVSVVGHFKPGDVGIMLVAVRHAGSAIWVGVDEGAFNLLVPVSPGHTIDFAVFGGWIAGNTPLIARIESVCYPDCDTSTGPRSLDIFDFLCFQNSYDQRTPYACDCDTSTGLGDCNIFDFLCFQNAYSAGCP